VIIASSECPTVVQACHLSAAVSLDEAIAYAYHQAGTAAQVLYLPHPLQTVPIVTQRA
jgi:hypothetical protein